MTIHGEATVDDRVKPPFPVSHIMQYRKISLACSMVIQSVLPAGVPMFRSSGSAFTIAIDLVSKY